jgi:microcystin-dependent protein
MVAAALLGAAAAHADEGGAIVPGTVNFQARLARVVEGAPQPLTGIQHVAFRLYDAAEGGTLVWARAFPVTCTADGTFNIVLDDGGSVLGSPAEEKLVDAFQGTERYFELEVEGVGTLKPRMRVPTAPYAFNAQYALWGEAGFEVGGTLSVADDATFRGAVVADSASLSNLTVGAAGGSLGSATVTGDVLVPTNKLVEGKGVIPVGGILIWTQEDIPDGWAVCDGGTTNGLQTPDLRGLFVMGADDSHAAGSTGGASSVALSLSEMPRHNHGFTAPAGSGQGTAGCIVHDSGSDVWNDVNGTSKTNTSVVGQGEAHENRPPYWAVYYIMRVW